MLFITFLLTLCFAETTFYATKDWSFFGGDFTAVKQDNSVLYKVDRKVFTIGHDFKLTDANNQQIVKAEQKFTWNPKSWVMAQYKLLYLENGQWKKANIHRKKFWDFGAYKTYLLEIDGETFESKGDVFNWKFEIKSQKDQASVAKLDLVGQDVFKWNIPNLTTYRAQVDDSRLNPSLVASMLAIVEMIR